MNAAEDFGDIPAFVVRIPARQRAPFVFNSPHSGRHYPERFLQMTKLDSRSIRRSEDCYVDDLFAGAHALGVPMLSAVFPRAYLDVNREPFELDPRMFVEPLPPHANARSARVAGGLGTVPRVVGEGVDIYPSRLPLSEAMNRIEAYYRPYHQRLRGLVMATHAMFGRAILVDCHSMPASVRVGESGMRPDFIIGDRFGQAAAAGLSELAISILRHMGYRVAHNKPYAGGFITEHYGRPSRGLHALQIEVNRGLYMDETSFERTAGFDALTGDLTAFSESLIAGAEALFDGIALAAE